MLPHSGKVVLVVGAVKDVGVSVARTFAGQGADLILWTTTPASDDDAVIDSTAIEVARLARDTGCRAITTNVDLRDQVGLDAAVLAGLDTFGHIDVAVVLADAQPALRFLDSTDTQWQTLVDAGLSGVWRAAKAVTPHMVQRHSGAFLVATPLRVRAPLGAASAAVGHGLRGLLEAMAAELGDYDIRVNSVVYDVLADTDDERHLDSELASTRAPAPDEVAAAVSWLASEAAHNVTGAEVPVKSGQFIVDLYL